MAVYDRWHRDARDGEQPCACGRGRKKLYPSAAHGRGDRWQVRYRDPDGRQRKKSFPLRDPADAFDAQVQHEIGTDSYTDPDAGKVTLRAYAEQWRATRVHGESAAAGLESRLRNHVYEGVPGSGRTPMGGVAIGQHRMGLLARRPSLVAAWVASVPLADSSRLLVLGDVSAVFRAAVEDGVARSDPTGSRAVDRPRRGRGKAQPYAPAEVAGIAACMPPRFAVLPFLGAGTGMREMEMAALGADDIVRGPRPKVRVVRQLKQVDGKLMWGPVKNRKAHDVPAPVELLGLLDTHMRAFPPLTVTLPWHEPGSKLHGTMMTVRLILSRDGRAPATRNVTDAAWRTGASRWLKAQGRVIGPARGRNLARGYGVHRLRHTFASTQLRDGTDVVRVAAWLGDTVQVVTSAYAHLMPGDHDGEQAGRSATAAFLGACAPDVPGSEDKAKSSQLRAV